MSMLRGGTTNLNPLSCHLKQTKLFSFHTQKIKKSGISWLLVIKLCLWDELSKVTMRLCNNIVYMMFMYLTNLQTKSILLIRKTRNMKIFQTIRRIMVMEMNLKKVVIAVMLMPQMIDLTT